MPGGIETKTVSNTAMGRLEKGFVVHFADAVRWVAGGAAAAFYFWVVQQESHWIVITVLGIAITLLLTVVFGLISYAKEQYLMNPSAR